MYILIAFFLHLSCIHYLVLLMHIFQTVFLIKQHLLFLRYHNKYNYYSFLFLFGTPTLPSWSSLTVIFIVGAIDVFYQIPYYIAFA